MKTVLMVCVIFLQYVAAEEHFQSPEAQSRYEQLMRGFDERQREVDYLNSPERAEKIKEERAEERRQYNLRNPERQLPTLESTQQKANDIIAQAKKNNTRQDIIEFVQRAAKKTGDQVEIDPYITTHPDMQKMVTMPSDGKYRVVIIALDNSDGYAYNALLNASDRNEMIFSLEKSNREMVLYCFLMPNSILVRGGAYIEGNYNNMNNYKTKMDSEMVRNCAAVVNRWKSAKLCLGCVK